jgi:hypothetical protein
MSWHHLGVWHTSNREYEACCTMAGWLCASRATLGVQVDDNLLDLLVNGEDATFLEHCAERDCWISGAVIMTRRAKLMVPHEVSLFGQGECPRPSAVLARMLAENMRASHAREAWLEVISAPPLRRPVHPMARTLPPRALDEPASLGYIFARHLDADIASGTSRFFLSAQTPLGSSGWAYDHERRECVRLQGALAPHTPKGAAIVADEPQVLLRALRGCCLLGAALVVAPREALAGARHALLDLAPRVACCERDLQEPPDLLLVSAELLAKRHAYFVARRWRRVLLVDWPRVVQHLSPCDVTLLPCDLQISLLMSQQEPPRLALLLGCAEQCLATPEAARALLRERVLRLRLPAQRRVLRYSLEHAPPATARERDEAAAFEGFDAQLAELLGSASKARHRLPALPPDVSVAAHFRAASSFAKRSFQADAPGCAVCLADAGANAVTRCGHWFCGACIRRCIAASKRCPVCRVSLGMQDVVALRDVNLGSSFLDHLAALLQREAQRTLVLASFGASLERVARALRARDLCAWAWSGNARQLLRNSEAFAAHEAAVLVGDAEFLALDWELHLHAVALVVCVLPLRTDRRDICCQLRAVARSAPAARLLFLGRANLAHERLSCADCPMLVQHDLVK